MKTPAPSSVVRRKAGLDPARPAVSVYRADIDGLRAVAVAGVVLFHAFPGWLPGGFVGVDVFFVISGYLISRIILVELREHRFRLASFYARRIRRIFPALSVVLAAVLASGWLLLLPPSYAQLGKHVAAGAGFVSNVVLLGESGYFDTDAATKPLLHLWSLGIEEQFYLVWPLLLALGARLRRTAFAIGVTLAASFVVGILLLRSHPAAAFYSPLTRFWELAIGGALALRGLRPGPAIRLYRGDDGRLSRALPALFSALGAGLIAVSAVLFSERVPFPGWRALVPTVGASMMVCAGPQAWLNRRVLSLSPVAFVGKISFPLYLWHWPLLAFARIVCGTSPAPGVRVALLALSFALASATYRWVETPLRRAGGERWGVPALSGAMLSLFFVGLLVLQQRGFSGARGPWNVTNVSAVFGEGDQFTEACRHEEAALFAPRFEPGIDFCHSSRVMAGGPVDVVVVGDSHAGRVYAGLAASTSLRGASLGRASCLPWYDYEASHPGQPEPLGCSPTIRRVLDRAITMSPRTVVLAGYFVRPYDGQLEVRGSEPMSALVRRTLVHLAASVPKVVIVLDVPVLPFDPSSCVERPALRGLRSSTCSFSRAALDEARARYEGDLREGAKGLQNVVFFDPAEVLCDATRCVGVRDSQLLYDDPHHLSRDGATLIARALARLL